MCLVVSGVGFLIHVYSAGYMHDDEGFARYFTYLNLFVFMMLTLVTANNLLLMFVGWEGVGLCSYLLIGFWYKRDSASNAGKKAFIVNRIGDFGFLLGIFLLVTSLGAHGVWTLNFGELQQNAHLLTGRRGDAHHPASSSSAPRANRRSFPSTCGCPTPWKARRRSARSSTRPPWSRPAST